MKDKATFFKNLSIVIVVALMGALLIASYFIPIMGSSEHSSVPSYSCRDVVVAMKATKQEDLSTASIQEAWSSISENEGKAGQLLRVVGVLGMINAMIGAALLICAVATIFIKSNLFRVASISFAAAALGVSIAIVAILCSYLGLPTILKLPYSYYYSIKAGSFVMMAASLFGGVGSWFLGFFEKAKPEVANN